MSVYILTRAYKNDANCIEIIGVFSHYNAAFDNVYENDGLEFALVNEVTWETGWTRGKEPYRCLLAKWTVQS